MAPSPEHSLAGLGNDVIFIILDMLQDESPGTVASMTLVSSYFYKKARYSQHRELSIDISQEIVTPKRLDYAANNGLLPAIRHLKVGGIRPRTRAEHDTLSKLCRLIPSMSGLTYVTWDFTIPLEALVVIQERPGVRIHTNSWSSHIFHKDKNPIVHLRGNLNLHSLDIGTTYTGAEECLQTTQRLKCILLSCPNLRCLKLNLSLPSSRYIIYSEPSEYCGFGFTNGERPPPLEELELDGYPWGYWTADTSSNDPFRQHGYPLKGREEDYWAETFDWSQLKRLSTHYSVFALQIMPQLISLRELDCRGWDHDRVKTFHLNVPAALESITVSSFAGIGMDGLLRHGPKLKKLVIHQAEACQGRWRDAVVDAKTLRNVRDACPLLVELGLDVGRDGSWPYDILETLATFPRLRSLTIWFELGLGHNQDPVEPYVTFSEAVKLFKSIRDHSPAQPSRLQRAEIISGSPPPIGLGLTAPSDFWPKQNSTSFVCTVSERDDEAERGVFSVVCPNLKKEENEMLRKLDAEGPGDRTGLSYRRVFEVALWGPAPYSEADTYDDDMW
ncbi:uncharacterized protein BCR38DRAFT_446553 [Pseudomassariella vexata]|uniref:F-box domain-containing protein n=1 Tax=Pseudomassariella vexata TaxID=1141098 RepID=A0A1Y2DHQ4_9PEZI|nr:uncharacterized protein BCR38DRAFT_446553 [Pseudomassariella vexata]ORY58781.1 hypothetical protein BCR38DRAFT_446553 [Pseudomassariella vexata]